MLNITIDGYAGCGKSTLAKGLAKSLNIYHFNTGNVYRTIACEYLYLFGDAVSKENIQKFVQNLKVEVCFINGEQVCFANVKNYKDELRTEKTSSFVAKISPYPEIREVVRKIQRDFANKNDCIMEGRDIGRVVLPNAKVKLFLTATPEVRAERRFKELNGEATYEDVLSEIIKRDNDDIHREEGALIPAEDAHVVDSSNMSIEQTLNYCVKIVENATK